jgi:UDP-arabinose 4-epimerase
MTAKILVTGGAGYIGSHACKALSRAGFVPVTYDNICLGHEEYVQWGPLVRGDTQDSDLVRQTIEDHGIEAVIHFAAYAYVGESTTDPARYYANNVGGTLGLLNGMRAAGCDKLVFSSTCAVYGEPGPEPISERTPPNPVNPYGKTKLVCEGMLADFAAAYGLDYTALRYFNASGDDADGDVGEDREIETHLIPRAMMAVLGYVDDFQVFGSDFDTPDGTAIRDYIHVTDLADAHVLALQRMRDGARGGATFNLGVGTGYSVGDVLRMISEVSGRPLAAPRGARRPGDPAQLIADAALARSEIGFAPAHSDLRTIVSTAWNWHVRTHPQRGAPAALTP